MALNKHGKTKRKRGKYWLHGHHKRLNPTLYMEKLAEHPKLRRFFKAFVNLSHSGYMNTAAGLHQLCKEEGLRVSLGTVYNFLKKLDRLGIIEQHFNGRTSYFDLNADKDNYWDLVDIVWEYSD